MESVDSFRQRAREWLADNMPRRSGPGGYDFDDRDAAWSRARVLQRTLWDGGFAGICFPADYGGLGLTPAHQQAFTEESIPYEMPLLLNIPTFTILGATLVDFGTHEQKLRYLPAMLRGEELWVQFLSEPTGGSDLAGSITRADRDGDIWLLNGSKIWSSAAYACDYAMCLARTNWDVPKHRGLTMFIVKIHQPAITIEQIKQVNGSMEFCQEFFDDVQLTDDDVIGEVDDGWTIASRLLQHERSAVGGGSPYASGRMRQSESLRGAGDPSLVNLARAAGTLDDSHVRQLVAEARVLDLVQPALVQRLLAGMSSGKVPAPASAILRLFTGKSYIRKTQIGLTIAGQGAVAWSDRNEPGRPWGEDSLARQGSELGGGSSEMARNIISERVLGMPREWAADKDVPYRDVRKNKMPSAPR